MHAAGADGAGTQSSEHVRGHCWPQEDGGHNLIVSPCGMHFFCPSICIPLTTRWLMQAHVGAMSSALSNKEHHRRPASRTSGDTETLHQLRHKLLPLKAAPVQLVACALAAVQKSLPLPPLDEVAGVRASIVSGWCAGVLWSKEIHAHTERLPGAQPGQQRGHPG